MWQRRSLTAPHISAMSQGAEYEHVVIWESDKPAKGYALNKAALSTPEIWEARPSPNN